MHRILFVCIENSTRSQMAEAFARIHGADFIEAASAGTRPSGTINPLAVEVLRERGYDLAAHRSKNVSELAAGRWDYIVTMGCGDECPWVPAAHREEWELPDPHGLAIDGMRALADDIERRVVNLIARIRVGEGRS
jgi:arsenate reductase